MIKELVEYIVKKLVEFPDQVTVHVQKEGRKSTLQIKVAESDRGKVIGRQGQTIKAIRGLVSTVVPSDKKVNVDIE